MAEDKWSYKFGRKEGMREGIRTLISILEEICPHDTLCADTSKAMKKDCDLCWKEIKSEYR